MLNEEILADFIISSQLMQDEYERPLPDYESCLNRFEKSEIA